MTDSSEIRVVRTPVQIEHIRIDSQKSYTQVKAALEKLPKFDDEIRSILRNGEIASVN